MIECLHFGEATEYYDFELPYIGRVRLCWDCRREFALRTLERPFALLPIDCGRIGYQCNKCGGEFTTTDSMTCKCPERKVACAATAEAFKEYFAWQELTNKRNKPKVSA